MSNTTSVKCFAHYHMTPAEYGLWDVCRSLSHESGVLYFSGRNVAARFKGLGKTGAYNLAASLVESGWFQLLKDSVRRKDGTWSPRQYKVLSHAEWANTNPNICGQPVLNSDQPVLEEGQDEDSPVLNSDQPVLNNDQPVQASGHNLKENYLYKTTDIEPDNHKPVQTSGLDDFKNRFLKPKAFARQRKAAASMVAGAPVPIRGQDGNVLDTQSQAEHIAVTISNTLGLQSGNDRLAWTTGVRQLLDTGQSGSDVLACAEHAYTCLPKTMRKEGPEGFVKNFDLIKQGWKNQSQKGISA